MRKKRWMFVKAHVDTFTCKDGVVVQAHDTKVQAAPANGPTTHASLKKHPMYSASDHRYFKDKGYAPHQIKEIWDRDHALGKTPLVHRPAPDVVGALSGLPAGARHEKKAAGRKRAAAAAPVLDPHPSVIGHATEVKPHGFTFEGKHYRKTYKEGTSNHDGTPVAEYEHAASGHRVWKDAQDRIHADGAEEAKKRRAISGK